MDTISLLQLATCPSRFEFSSQSLNLLSKSDRSQETIETLYGIQIKAKVSLLNLENILHIDHKDFFGKYAQHNLVWVCVGGYRRWICPICLNDVPGTQLLQNGVIFHGLGNNPNGRIPITLVSRRFSTQNQPKLELE